MRRTRCVKRPPQPKKTRPRTLPPDFGSRVSHGAAARTHLELESFQSVAFFLCVFVFAFPSRFIAVAYASPGRWLCVFLCIPASRHARLHQPKNGPKMLSFKTRPSFRKGTAPGTRVSSSTRWHRNVCNEETNSQSIRIKLRTHTAGAACSEGERVGGRWCGAVRDGREFVLFLSHGHCCPRHAFNFTLHGAHDWRHDARAVLFWTV